jgi:hypothetical protein
MRSRKIRYCAVSVCRWTDPAQLSGAPGWRAASERSRRRRWCWRVFGPFDTARRTQELRPADAGQYLADMRLGRTLAEADRARRDRLTARRQRQVRSARRRWPRGASTTSGSKYCIASSRARSANRALSASLLKRIWTSESTASSCSSWKGISASVLGCEQDWTVSPSYPCRAAARFGAADEP